jgi:hypothetical protein
LAYPEFLTANLRKNRRSTKFFGKFHSEEKLREVRKNAAGAPKKCCRNSKEMLQERQRKLADTPKKCHRPPKENLQTLGEKVSIALGILCFTT